MTHVSCPSALGLMDNAQNIAIARDFRKCEKYLTLPRVNRECPVVPLRQSSLETVYNTEDEGFLVLSEVH